MTKELNFKQELTAAFGQPIAENPTQAMIEAAYRHHGLDWRYLTIEVAAAGLGDAVRGARAMGFAGFNCTIPHKVAVIEHLDGLGESAALMGAVNTIVRQGDELVGENTDGKGFLRSLRTVTEPEGKRAVIFGAGGAARAISVELAMAGIAELRIVNRTPKRGQELADLVAERLKIPVEFVAWEGDYDVPPQTDVLVNATSIGLFPNVDQRVPVNLETLDPAMVVCDAIPNPPQTPFLREARQRGCTTLDGLGMLVQQGVIAFRLWTGVDPNPAVMHAALKGVFES